MQPLNRDQVPSLKNKNLRCTPLYTTHRHQTNDRITLKPTLQNRESDVLHTTLYSCKHILRIILIRFALSTKRDRDKLPLLSLKDKLLN